MAVNLDTLNPKQLSDLIVRAGQRKNALAEDRAGKVREKLIATAKAEGFTIEQLFGSAKKRKRVVAPKFRNPVAPYETWSGRGRQPRWYLTAIKAGKKDKDLLIL